MTGRILTSSKKLGIPLLFGFVSLCISATQVIAAAAIELVPVVVWQGVPLKPFQSKAWQDLRDSMDSFRTVHFVSPVYLMRGASEAEFMQSLLAHSLGQDDVIGMHVAPLRDWAEFARAKPGEGKGIYGQTKDQCDVVCGLDQEIAGLKTSDYELMLQVAKSEFKRAGFGRPELALFEEGFVPVDFWESTQDEGFKEDWSGFNLEATKPVLGRYPFYVATVAQSGAPLFGNSSVRDIQGRSLDHFRFGLLMDAVSLADVQKVMAESLAFAKAHKRSVLVPLIINGASVIHTQTLVRGAIMHAKTLAAESGVDLVSLSDRISKNWTLDTDELKKSKAAALLALETMPEATGPANDSLETEVTEESRFELKMLNELPVTHEIPSEQNVIPSHARQMSH